MQTLDWLNKDKTLPTSDPRRLWREEDIDELQAKFNANVSEAAAHIASTSNPHSVTKAQVGLSDVENLSIAARLLTANIVKRETPSGAVPGSAFATAFPLIAGSEELFRNGQLLDYTISYTMTGQNIALVLPLESWESLKINYIKS